MKELNTYTQAVNILILTLLIQYKEILVQLGENGDK